MNDRFKFRVPVFDEGKFLCFHFFNAIDGADHYREIGPYAHGKEEQCTGLKDKNGELIYEGDIVFHRDKNVAIGKVEWDKGGFVVVCNKWVIPWNFFTPSLWEVVGNVHEDPELLEDK